MTKQQTKKKVGRPRLMESPQQMQKKIDNYFANCPDVQVIVREGVTIERPCPTITGLALYLGFADRTSMFDYELKPEFRGTIKIARARMERIYESMLHNQNCTGAIFALKNFGWKDERQVKSDVNISLDVTGLLNNAEQYARDKLQASRIVEAVSSN